MRPFNDPILRCMAATIEYRNAIVDHYCTLSDVAMQLCQAIEDMGLLNQPIGKYTVGKGIATAPFEGAVYYTINEEGGSPDALIVPLCEAGARAYGYRVQELAEAFSTPYPKRYARLAYDWQKKMEAEEEDDESD